MKPATLHLKVEIDEQSGFCFGVKNAIEKAERQLQEGGELFCLGEIVHNSEENQRLIDLGMIIIGKDQLDAMEGRNVLFRAHGEPPSSYDRMGQKGNTLIDGTCSIVLKIQERIQRSWSNGEKIFIFGKKDHPETIGLNGHTNNEAVVFDDLSQLDPALLPSNITLYSQTTMSPEKFRAVVDFLEEAGIEVNAKDTICRQVSGREPHLREFSNRFDKIIFIAGSNSSNGKVLFEVCKSQNSASMFISSPDELQSDWFTAGETVGICGATSTPLWLMEKVKEVLLGY